MSNIYMNLCNIIITVERDSRENVKIELEVDERQRLSDGP